MNPILVDVYRGGLLESFHRGVICVVNAQNQVVFSVGDVQQICYPRSAMKLFQVIPLIEHGGIQKFGFTLQEIAIMCGSHNAEKEHVTVVNAILNKIGLTPENLNCGAQYPSSKKDADALIKADVKPHHIHNNCSGKHAGMLATCVLMGWPTSDYLNPNHPLQLAIKQTCAMMYEYPLQKMLTALDGCSAPIYSVPVINQAIGYKNLVSNQHLPEVIQQACKIIVDAVSQYPFMVAGSKRYCTDMMQITAPKIIGKTGAEGIFCMTFTEQSFGVCIKIDDGKMLPQYNVAQALVSASGLFTQAELSTITHHLQAPIINFNKLTTGEINISETLNNELPKFKKLFV